MGLKLRADIANEAGKARARPHGQQRSGNSASRFKLSTALRPIKRLPAPRLRTPGGACRATAPPRDPPQEAVPAPCSLRKQFVV
eukprot:14775570-Alexandrium_andersonii.AAC.1